MSDRKRRTQVNDTCEHLFTCPRTFPHLPASTDARLHACDVVGRPGLVVVVGGVEAGWSRAGRLRAASIVPSSAAPRPVGAAPAASAPPVSCRGLRRQRARRPLCLDVCVCVSACVSRRHARPVTAMKPLELVLMLTATALAGSPEGEWPSCGEMKEREESLVQGMVSCDWFGSCDKRVLYGKS